MATRSPYVAVDGTYVGNTDTTLITSGTNERLTVTSAIATNVGTATETIKVHRVESGGSVGDEKIIQNTLGIAPGSTVVLDKLVGAVLEPNDFLSAVASTASKITVQIFASRYIS